MAKTFWSQASLEPKRQFRFVLNLGPFEQYVITKVNRPSFEVGESEHNYINHKFYYPGRVTWNDVSFTMVDPVKPDTTGILMKMLMASGYRFPNFSSTTRTISKAEAVGAVGSCTIQMLGTGDPDILDGQEGASAEALETWSLKNPWMKSVTMGDLDYGADDILTMDVTLRYDWATLSIHPSRAGGENVSTAEKLTPKGGLVGKVPDGLISGGS
jgi:hypothetical protein